MLGMQPVIANANAAAIGVAFSFLRHLANISSHSLEETQLNTSSKKQKIDRY